MDVKQVAKLAHLHITDDEAGVYQPQMESIVKYIEQLDELDTSAVEPMTGGLTSEGASTTAMREDIPGGSLGQDAATSQAPAAVSGHFRVPKVL